MIILLTEKVHIRILCTAIWYNIYYEIILHKKNFKGLIKMFPCFFKVYHLTGKNVRNLEKPKGKQKQETGVTSKA